MEQHNVLLIGRPAYNTGLASSGPTTSFLRWTFLLADAFVLCRKNCTFTFNRSRFKPTDIFLLSPPDAKPENVIGKRLDGQYKMTIDSTTYFNDLTSSFPDLCTDISSEDGDHMKMERFADYTIVQIKKSDFVELKKCFDFQENKIQSLNADLENAMTVSYCESLLLGEVSKVMPQIVKYMGPKLLKMYRDYETYYNELGERSRGKKQ